MNVYFTINFLNCTGDCSRRLPSVMKLYLYIFPIKINKKLKLNLLLTFNVSVITIIFSEIQAVLLILNVCNKFYDVDQLSRFF